MWTLPKDWYYTKESKNFISGICRMMQVLNKQSVIDLLEQHGIQSTQQRVEIAQILFAKPQHLSADQVLAKVNHERNLVSKATVYNSLGLFARKGIVREIIVDPNRVFYDSNTSEHHHFFNIDTGELSDFPSDTITVNELPELPKGTAADSIDIIFKVRNKVENSSVL